VPSPVVAGYYYEPADQPVLIEVWIENSTQNDILVPVCRQLGANLIVGNGMQSITIAVRLLERLSDHGKPGHVIYISDFDPAGDKMPTSVARQLEFYGVRDFPDAEVTVEHVALTHAQVLEHQLPRKPIETKDPNDGRKRKFEERHGEGAVELDALEALLQRPPGRTRRQVREPVHGPRAARRAVRGPQGR
jgi:hypothetical protein